MVVTLITDDVPYIFEDVTYISVDRDGTMFHVEHAENFILEDSADTCPKINAERLVERLNIALYGINRRRQVQRAFNMALRSDKRTNRKD